jgi:3-methyladenine DNA glycosylase/8-oxoguanine DNA glycosylase
MQPACETGQVTVRPTVPVERLRRWRPGRPLDLALVLGPMRRGSGDPTHRHVPGDDIWRATRTPHGPVTTAFRVPPGDDAVEVRAWGPGADWALDTAPDLLGAADDPTGFEPRHPVVAAVWRRHAGWRVPRSRRVLDALVPAVLEQKVTGREAWRAFRTLVRRYGESAPGPVGHLPGGLWVQPAPRAWATVPSWEWHRAGVDLSRSRAVVTAASSAGRLEALADVPPADAATRLRSLPGVGVWTAAEVAQRALGDADAVSVGDYHLSSLVGLALVGEKVDDDVMLELLEPYRGHRYRAVRMIELSGVRPERHGPRYEGRDYRAM